MSRGYRVEIWVRGAYAGDLFMGRLEDANQFVIWNLDTSTIAAYIEGREKAILPQVQPDWGLVDVNEVYLPNNDTHITTYTLLDIIPKNNGNHKKQVEAAGQPVVSDPGGGDGSAGDS